MPHWLIVYRPDQDRLLRCEEYADGQEALRERFRLERLERAQDMEIAVLGADSLETLKVTHSRYFFRLDGLLASRLTGLGGPTP